LLIAKQAKSAATAEWKKLRRFPEEAPELQILQPVEHREM
jgi:hypothetical protein